MVRKKDRWRSNRDQGLRIQALVVGANKTQRGLKGVPNGNQQGACRYYLWAKKVCRWCKAVELCLWHVFILAMALLGMLTALKAGLWHLIGF